jgi:hypothetical protein
MVYIVLHLYYVVLARLSRYVSMLSASGWYLESLQPISRLSPLSSPGNHRTPLPFSPP